MDQSSSYEVRTLYPFHCSNSFPKCHQSTGRGRVLEVHGESLTAFLRTNFDKSYITLDKPKTHTLIILFTLLNMVMAKIVISGAGESVVNGEYTQRDSKIIPKGFAATCDTMGWESEAMWQRLADDTKPWFEHENGSYIYRNKGDGKWWIDEPSGKGVYIVSSTAALPPPRGWEALSTGRMPCPHVEALVSKTLGPHSQPDSILDLLNPIKDL